MPVNQDDPAATYVAAAIPADSIEYFVILMTASELRPVVAAGIALAKVIENIPRQTHEPQIAQLKLHWWLEEIEMIGRAEPRHPLSIDIAGGLSHQAWLEPLHALVSGVLSDINRAPFRSLTELLPYCHRLAGRQALIASVLPQCDELALTHARTLGVGIALTGILCELPDFNARVPEKGLDGDPAAVTARKLADIADDHYRAAAILPPVQRRAQSSVALQAGLYRRLLDRLRRSDFDPNKTPMHPLQLLWHAWREARNLIR